MPYGASAKSVDRKRPRSQRKCRSQRMPLITGTVLDAVDNRMSVGVSLCSNLAPVPVENPGVLLTFLAAILGAAAPTTLGKLSCPLLPSTALIVRALTNTTTGIIFPAQIPHHDTRPVLHVLRMVADCEFLNQREYIEIVGKQVFLLISLVVVEAFGGSVIIESIEVLANFQLRDKVGLLEVRPEVAVFGHISKELQ